MILCKSGDSLKILRIVKKNAVFCISALAALVTCFLVPPDKMYPNYFDWKTLSCLFLTLVHVLTAWSTLVSTCPEHPRLVDGTV